MKTHKYLMDILTKVLPMSKNCQQFSQMLHHHIFWTFQRQLWLHSVGTLIGFKRSMMSTYTLGCRLWNMLLLVLEYGFYPVKTQARKGKIRRDYAESYHMLDTRICTIEFGLVIIFQFRIESFF